MNYLFRFLLLILVLSPSTLFADTISGTGGDDLIVINLASSTARVNGEVADIVRSPVIVNAGAGEDRIVVIGDAAAAEVVRMNGKTMNVADGVRVVRVADGEQLVFLGDDDDRAVLLDSAGDDRLDISDTQSLMTCPAFSYFVRGVSRINVTADRGGNDTVNVLAEEVGHLNTHEDCVRLAPAEGSTFPTTHFLFGFEKVNTSHVSSFVLEDTPNDDLLIAFEKSIRWVTDDYEIVHSGDYQRLSALSRAADLSGLDRAVVKLPKLDETLFSFSGNSVRRNERNVYFSNVQQRVLVQNFSDNEFEVLPGPSTQDARAVFVDDFGARDWTGRGSLETRSFHASARGINIDATGFDDFNINRFYSRNLFSNGLSIEDSSFDDDYFLASEFARFEGNDCLFRVNFDRRQRPGLLSAVNGGVDSIVTVGLSVSAIGDVSHAGAGRVNFDTATRLLGFEEEIHVGDATNEARVHSQDDQHHRVLATPNSLSFTPPSGNAKTFVGFGEYHVLAASERLARNSQYGPANMDVVYDNRNDSSVSESTEFHNYNDFRRDFSFINGYLCGRAFTNSKSTLFIASEISPPDPFSFARLPQEDSIPGAEDILILNAPTLIPLDPNLDACDNFFNLLFGF